MTSTSELLPGAASSAALGSLTSAGRSGDSEGAAYRHLRQSSKAGYGAPVAVWKLYEWIGSVLDLDLLRSFVSVVDAGGFTRAGERVHRTQSTVSQQIRRLEKGFGRPLLHRDGKRISPTEEGERLLAGYLLRQSADRISCKASGTTAEVQLHYYH